MIRPSPSRVTRSAVRSPIGRPDLPVGASLYLDMASAGQTLDPRITFTRASTGSYYGSNGLLALSPVNLLTYSEQFDNAAWTKSNATITANAVTAPDGTLTADALVDTAANFAHTTYGTSLSLTADIVYTVSVYLKTGTLRYASVRGESVGSASTYPWITVDLQTGSVDANANVASASATAVGNGWYRVVMTFVKFGTTVGSGNMVFSGSNVATAPGTASVLGNAYVGTGSTFYIWGAQLQTGSTATTYIPTTATASGAPRFDYDPVTLQPKGLLIEEQRTNLLTYSSELDNAAWTKTDLTVTANAITAPDGTLSADLLTAGSAGSDTLTSSNPAVAASSTNTASFYVKYGNCQWIRVLYMDVTGTDGCTLWVDVQNGVLGSFINRNAGTAVQATISAAGSGWYRVSITGIASTRTNASLVVVSATANNSGTRVSGATYYLWGAQLEAGAFATSYIPTVAAQVTRAADKAVMTGTNFSSWFNATEGTFAASGAPVTTTPTPFSFILEGQNPAGTAATITIGVGSTSSNFSVDIRQTAGGISGNQTIPYSFNPSTPFKAAGAYLTGTNGGIAFNGSIITPNMVDPQNTATSLAIGSRVSSNYWNGWVRNVTYWPRRLSNAELQSVTA